MRLALSPARPFAPPLLAAAVAACVASAACAGDAPADAADSALARDLALAAGPAPARSLTDSAPGTLFADTAEASPAPPPVVVPPVPRRPSTPPPAAPPPAIVSAPTPVPDAAAPDSAPAAMPATAPADAAPRATRTLAAGTALVVATQSAVCSSRSRPGDRFVARVQGDVAGGEGVVEPGTLVVLEVVDATPDAGGDADGGTLRFRVRALSVGDSSYALAAEVLPRTAVETTRTRAGGDAGGRAARGAVVGAILGRVLGGDARSTVGGAAAGAAVGAVTGRGTVTTEGCFPAGGVLDVRLTEGVTVVVPG